MRSAAGVPLVLVGLFASFWLISVLLPWEGEGGRGSLLPLFHSSTHLPCPALSCPTPLSSVPAGLNASLPCCQHSDRTA